MAENAPSGSSLGSKLFVGFLVIATAVLSLLVVRLTQQKNTLLSSISKYQAAIEKYESAIKAQGLTIGDVVDDVQLIDAEAKPFLLDFAKGKPFTLFLLTSAGCEGCESTIPVWESVLTEVQPKGLRMVNVCAGVMQPSELAHESSPIWPSYMAPSGREGWIRQIPLAPATLLIGPEGAIVQRWYGPLSEAQAAQLRAALIDVAGG